MAPDFAVIQIVRGDPADNPSVYQKILKKIEGFIQQHHLTVPEGI